MDARDVRAELSGRLLAQRWEIEQAILTRVFAISNGSESSPLYMEGLRATVSSAITYGLEAIEKGEQSTPAVPTVLFTQARLAARSHISLDTVLRRYFAGYTVLCDFLVQEFEAVDFKDANLHQLMREQGVLFDRLTALIAHEYIRADRRRSDSAEHRRAEQVQRLLDGELVDLRSLSYAVDLHHLAVAGYGLGAADLVRELAMAIDRRLLLVQPAEETVWAWLGGQQPVDPDRVTLMAVEKLPPETCLALGGPGQGLAGWRLSHRQAAAALAVARRGTEPVVCYTDVSLLAAALQDDLLAVSLNRTFVMPLTTEHGRSPALDTLRAYFAAERNAASAAAALGITRQAMNGRLRRIEERLGLSIAAHAASFETALLVHDLDLGKSAGR